MKTYFLIILSIIFCTNSISAENKAFKGIKDINLVDELTGKKKTLVTVEKGDTMYANDATYQFLNDNEGNTIHYIPLEYKGVTGYAHSHEIYPIKISEQDTLKFIQTKRTEDRTVQERLLVPAIEWTMNTVSDYMTWFWFIVFSLVSALVFFVVSFSDKLKSFGLIMVGVSLSAASICEFFYILHATSYVIWFIYPSVVGGWGHVILNFIIFSAICGIQAGLYYYLAYTCITGNLRFKADFKKNNVEDDEYEDDDDESPNSLLKNMGLLPILIGFALMVMIWVDYFTGSKMSGTPFIVLISLLGVGGIIELIYLFKYRMWITGLLMPIFYILGGIGLAGIIMILGMLSVLIVIAGAIFAFLAILAVGAIGGLIGSMAQAGKRVEGIDEFGNKVTGTIDAFGDIHGDDGQTYKQKSGWF